MDRPLADRIRPETLEEVVGQRHLLGANALLRRFIEKGAGKKVFPLIKRKGR